jgi:branched-chain amino acid transport system permease protein
MRGRPLLYSSYEAEQAILSTWTKRVGIAFLIGLAIVIPAEFIPGLSWLGADDWLEVLTRAMIYGIGALGLNILTGLAGQVSLGHAFFVGLGAYTAAILGGSAGRGLWGLDLPIWLWLPAAGIVAALVGILVAPTAVRVRGLYLAFVTLGLVFIGEHIFRAAKPITGGGRIGRRFPGLELRLWKEEEPLLDFTSDGAWFGIELTGETKAYLLALGLLAVFAVITKNITRTRTGRAFMSIRDRDIAAEVMGVGEYRHKLLAFAISSFYAGVAGALLAAFVGTMIPESFNLFMSIEFIAIVLIGGAGTVAGTLLGTFFVMTLPRLVRDATNWLTDTADGTGALEWFGEFLITRGPGDFGLLSTQAVGTGLSIFQINVILYGLLIIGFLIFEPLGLYGIWIRVRNYWKGWPFTY